ncbi:hypothetical protein [Azotobacter beijerinckii]|uniref:PIN domain-containing protein n=1 Tax=Azotobacter beijerinckii TaxID=170623 RepID=A0A1I4AYJ2_9GAMM|nr:hypothetical protein [Azotobacter beijerinckii]SFB04123.1 hypothetical protein SAMN04244571_01219 [Azotobacter beijerinckii]SFK61220.1 hypothetical protein SAMN04244574_01222 [Azotobacter beijerinckii]
MSRRVLILDTSVLCCWLQVPGKEEAGPEHDRWNHARISQLLEEEQKLRSTLVLPLATLIETGNHIAQAADRRFERAQALARCLREAANAQSPWAAFTDQTELWQTENLLRLADNWPTQAAKKLSIGDATIKDVAEHYAKAGFAVEILTGDAGLKAYEPTQPVPIPRRRR